MVLFGGWESPVKSKGAPRTCLGACAEDTKHDDLVDVQEFAEWLTNVNATITVGLLGWHQSHELAS